MAAEVWSQSPCKEERKEGEEMPEGGAGSLAVPGGESWKVTPSEGKELLFLQWVPVKNC